MDSGQTLSFPSDFIVDYYYKATLGCLQYNDIQSCQQFAQICVLHLYNETKQLCALYRTKQEDISLNIQKIYFDANY
jgi:hypothetical protein